jgi:rhodanese-related sulfurtransferase
VLVDVRSQEEWNKGHLEDATFLPIDSLRKTPDPKMLAKKLPQKKVLYTFCVVGMRAKAAAIKLEQAGRPLKPGYCDLRIRSSSPSCSAQTTRCICTTRYNPAVPKFFTAVSASVRDRPNGR